MGIAATLVMALALAAVHLLAGHLGISRIMPRSRWLSLAGGASVAFVFLHILPELHEGQFALEENQPLPDLGFLRYHVFLMAMIGFAAFYGLEHLALISRSGREQSNPPPEPAPADRNRRENQARADRRSGDQPAPDEPGQSPPRPEPEPEAMLWVHLGAFALYNMLIGYLLLHREADGLARLVLFTSAVGLHFFVNDHALRDHHRVRYDRIGRWLLAAAVIAGWGLGVVVRLTDPVVTILFGLLAGALILNVIKEELPSQRRSAFWAFALGAAVYSLLLLI